ncbi:MAG: hypothetical protein IPN07_10770 [Dehalococcoidia bacterium]|nr:hypothetical protein [Dehalococcoidia bacterium]
MLAYYPLLTAPLASKTRTSFRCPDTHLEAVRAALSEADKVLVAGFSAYDTHVLEFINESVVTAPRRFDSVGLGSDTDPARDRFRDGAPAFFQCETAGGDQGFRAYVHGSEFQSWLAA